MFAVRRYTNPQGENLFVPTFGTEPSQPIPEGFTLAQQGPEGAQKILQKEGLSTTGEASEGVLIGAGLMAPKKKVEDATTTIDTADQLETETKVDVADTTTQIDTTGQVDIADQQDKNRIMSTEPPDVISPESVDRLTSQLKAQYNAIKQSSGYKYKNENELDYIFNNQARQLASYGINDIRDVGYEEGETYTVYDTTSDPSDSEATIETARQVTPKYLINKVTGKRIKTREEHTGLTDRGWGNRWGWDNSVEGSVDFGIEFVDDNAIFMPVYKSTKTDLTPLMMIGSVALMAAGVPASIGGSLAPAGASAATKAAIGQAVVAGGMTAISGGDLEDIAKAAVLSGGMSYVSAHLPGISKSIGETIVGKGVPGAVTVGTAITNAGVNGIAAMIMKQDVGKAMLAGAVQGAVQVNASDFLKSAFGEDVFKNLSNATNLSDKEMEGLFVRSLSKGAGSMAYNQNFFRGFRDNLLREGLSLSAANAATKGLSKNLSKDQLKKVHRTVRQTSSLAILAKQRGLNVSTVLESAYPKIILNTLKD